MRKLFYTPETEDDSLETPTTCLILTPEVLEFLEHIVSWTTNQTNPSLHRIHWDLPDLVIDGETYPALIRLSDDDHVVNEKAMLKFGHVDHHPIVSVNKNGQIVFRAELPYAVEYSESLTLEEIKIRSLTSLLRSAGLPNLPIKARTLPSCLNLREQALSCIRLVVGNDVIQPSIPARVPVVEYVNNHHPGASIVIVLDSEIHVHL